MWFAHRWIADQFIMVFKISAVLYLVSLVVYGMLVVLHWCGLWPPPSWIQ